MSNCCSIDECPKLHVVARAFRTKPGEGAIGAYHTISDARRFLDAYSGQRYEIEVAWPQRNSTVIESGRLSPGGLS